MGALGGYHLRRHESNYQRSPFTLGWTSLNFAIETNEETFRPAISKNDNLSYQALGKRFLPSTKS